MSAINLPDVGARRPPQNLQDAVFTKGVAQAIAYALNHPGVVASLGSDEYCDLMTLFQDYIPQHLIDPTQWWSCHYLYSGRTCSKCLEIAHLSPCDEPAQAHHLLTIVQNMSSGHAADCSVRSGLFLRGLYVSETLGMAWPKGPS